VIELVDVALDRSEMDEVAVTLCVVGEKIDGTLTKHPAAQQAREEWGAGGILSAGSGADVGFGVGFGELGWHFFIIGAPSLVVGAGTQWGSMS